MRQAVATLLFGFKIQEGDGNKASTLRDFDPNNEYLRVVLSLHLLF